MISRNPLNQDSREFIVLLVDDHPAIRKAAKETIRSRFPHASVIEAGTLSAARTSIARARPDVIVFDIELPDGSGFELLSEGRNDATTMFVCVSMHVDRRRILEALSRGANAYVSKESDPEEIAVAIEHVRAGRSHLCPHAAHVVVDWIQKTPDLVERGRDPRYQRLSPKEKDVFRLLSQGYDTTEMAELLSTSKKTISNYRSTVLSSLGLRSVRELIIFAEENGIR